MKIHSQSGVTLIEILIAVSLLSLLSVGMLMAMRIGFNTMEKTDAHLVKNRLVSNAAKIVEDEIAGFIFTRAEWRPKPEMARTVPYVDWQPSTMRFVTAYSLQDAWRGRPQVVVLQVIPGEHGEGVRLIVNETPYTGPAQTGREIAMIDADGTHFGPVAPGPQSFVLVDRLAYCHFTYLEPRPQPPLKVWRPDWIQPSRLPLGIRIDMAPLDHGAAEVHMSTITAQLNVTRDTGSYYGDAQ